MDFADKYKQLNKNFGNKCVFKIGDSEGFFSEINCLVYSLMYCFDKKYQFILTDSGANFSFDSKTPYEDFFVPFCEIKRDFVQKKFNSRTPFSNGIINFIIKQYKKINKISFFTQDIFNESSMKYFVLKDIQIDFDDLDLHGRTLDVIKPFAKMVWNFNDETKKTIENNILNLHLPNDYVSIQIRRGDKIPIQNNQSPQNDLYIDEIMKKTTCKNVFVLCDDYSDFQYLSDEYKDFNFYTLCYPVEHGYNNHNFQKMPNSIKKIRTLRLLTSISIILNSNLFIGTYIANPSIFIKMLMDEDKFYFIENLIGTR